MKKYSFSLLLSLSIIYSFQVNPKVSGFEPTFIYSDSTTHKISPDQDFQFGYLLVPENRNDASPDTIQLPVYIFKSRSKNPKKDPIIYTVGGPGSSTMRSSMYMKSYKYLDDRDLILFEQRGTQYARPHLSCPEWAQAIYESQLPNIAEKEAESLLEQAAKDCRERLIQEGIDLSAYHTRESAADIEDLRKVLKIEQYNFLSLSYSTKIAQVLLREYPESIRSVVMDSPLPLESNYDELSVGNLMKALDKILSDCGKDPACNEAFPELKERFYQYLRDKTERPLEVKIKHPKSGKKETILLQGKDLVAVFSLAYTQDVPNIPFEIHQLLKGNLGSVKAQLSSLFKGPASGNGIGMRLSVWCAEEYPFVSQERVEIEKTKYPEVLGLSPEVFSKEVCDIWKVERVPEIENQAVKSDIPVLFLSGEYDEATPPAFAAMMCPNFPNSHHLIFKGWKHGPSTNWSNPCAMQAANDFFNAPLSKPNPECLAKILSPKFKVK